MTFLLREDTQQDRLQEYILPLKRSKPPKKRYIIFDTETDRTKTNVRLKNGLILDRIILRYLYAHFVDEDLGIDEIYESSLDQDEEKEKRLWTQQLMEWCKTDPQHMLRDTTLHAWAHNALYDTRSSVDFNWLRKSGWTYMFVSTHPFIFKFEFLHNGRKNTVKILDTYSFFKQSLESLAPYVGMDKVKIDFEKYYASGTKVPKRILMQRCKSDVEITRRIVDYLYGVMPAGVAVSAPQLAFSTFRSMLTQSIQRLGGISIEAYHGGRTEIFKRLLIPDCTRYDVNSQYPFVMCKPLPYRLGMYYKNDHISLDNVLDMCHSEDWLATIKATVNIPERYIGPFPHWHDNKLLFPSGRYTTYINSPEFMINDNWRFIEKIHEVQYFEAAPFLRDFAKKFYAEKLRCQRGKDAIGREYNKLILNSTFGKFGQKEKKTFELPEDLAWLVRDISMNTIEDIEVPWDLKDYDLLKGDNISIMIINGIMSFSRTLDYNISPAVASFITSFARAYLQSLMVIAGEDLCYTDTDSLTLTHGEKLKHMVGDDMGKLKLEFEGDFEGYACKTYVANGMFGNTQKQEVKSKGVPREQFIQALRAGKQTVTYHHVYGLRESLKRFSSLSLFESDVVKKMSLTDNKRKWSEDGRNSLTMSISDF